MEKSKAKKRKIVKKKNLPPLIHVPIVEEGSDSNEPLAKKTKKAPEPPVVELGVGEKSSAPTTLVKSDEEEIDESPIEVMRPTVKPAVITC